MYLLLRKFYCIYISLDFEGYPNAPSDFSVALPSTVPRFLNCLTFLVLVSSNAINLHVCEESSPWTINIKYSICSAGIHSFPDQIHEKRLLIQH